MTCIIAYVDKINNIIVMGADSIGMSSDSKRVRLDSKLVQKNEFIIGFAGSFRQRDIVQYHLQLPEITTDIREYLVCKFVPAFKEALKESFYEDSICGMLVAYKDRLFVIECDLQVAENSNGFESIGVASEFAMGAMHILSTQKLTANTKVLKALNAAMQFSSGVSEPFHLMQTKS